MSVTVYLHDMRAADVCTEGKSSFPDRTFMDLICFEADGTSVFLRVVDFYPSFIVAMRDDVGDASDESALLSWKDEVKDTGQWYWNVKRADIIMRKRLLGFTDGREFPFLEISFGSQPGMYYARKLLGADKRVEVYESNVNAVLKFMHRSKVRPSSYFKAGGLQRTPERKKVSLCEKEYTVRMVDLEPVSDPTIPPPPIVICAYDIESSGTDPSVDAIFQVSMCFSRLGDEIDHAAHAVDACKDGVVICVGPTESVDGTPIAVVANEMELLYKFRDVLVERGVGIMAGYNNHHFDAQFMFHRATVTYSMADYTKLSFLKDHHSELTHKKLRTSEMDQVAIPGRVEFDLYITMRKKYKFQSYKLDSVSKHFFGGEKDDVTYADILEAFRGKDPHKKGVIAKYCYQDSWLVIRLMERIKDIQDSMAMSRLTVVPLDFILNRGEQIKAMSLIMDRLHGEYVCNRSATSGQPDINVKSDEADGGAKGDGYQGACVIDAKGGFYRDESDRVVTLDFAR
jgi:DNA polymerase delta subunit 1